MHRQLLRKPDEGSQPVDQKLALIIRQVAPARHINDCCQLLSAGPKARRSGWKLSGNLDERDDAAVAPKGGRKPDRRGNSGTGAIRQDRTVWPSRPTG